MFICLQKFRKLLDANTERPQAGPLRDTPENSDSPTSCAMLAASAWRRRARHAGVALRAQHAGVALRARRGRALEKQVFERLGRMLQWSCNIIPWHARNRQPL